MRPTSTASRWSSRAVGSSVTDRRRMSAPPRFPVPSDRPEGAQDRVDGARGPAYSGAPGRGPGGVNARIRNVSIELLNRRFLVAATLVIGLAVLQGCGGEYPQSA